MLQLHTDEAAIGKRLDQWLADALQGDFSRSQLQTLIKNGNVYLDDICATSAKRKLQGQELIKIVVPEPIAAQPVAQNISLDILYEDEDVILINKPAGLVVHPGAGNYDSTLVNALLHHCADSLSGIGGVKRPGIVHRLDKNTSGVMIAAKDDMAHRHLSEQFLDHGRQGYLQRRYVAIIWGAPQERIGIINTYLARSTKDRTKRAVVQANSSGAKHAVTHYKLLASFCSIENNEPLVSIVECSLETGRTHQIRVHLAHINCPLLGDTVYGSGFKTKALKLPFELESFLHRQALHAEYLQFIHPRSEKLMNFIAKLPADMASLLDQLHNSAVMRKINYN
ncbi:RluA family pseudouridine synthase [Bartonella sp. TP]|uniref:RluA family pseudouridine synthase n=1 Tax=Bartonella sp. TP TaxID=3057550 RepID=UPI0025B11A7F|nr:RluA family pseudouridine synthase [Bartonella sp. TP]MDN5248878.1 RluA family pseudouridine synthase [Alphaproteobacteria bacterium]WJW79598.1 RluA family pseudouridine synthase [Bartonella sp. TP]